MGRLVNKKFRVFINGGKKSTVIDIRVFILVPCRHVYICCNLNNKTMPKKFDKTLVFLETRVPHYIHIKLVKVFTFHYKLS